MDCSQAKLRSINNLLTEISLKLLGNEFYDNFGRKVNSLNQLTMNPSLGPPQTHVDHSDLLSALDLTSDDLTILENDVSEAQALPNLEVNMPSNRPSPSGGDHPRPYDLTKNNLSRAQLLKMRRSFNEGKCLGEL